MFTLGEFMKSNFEISMIIYSFLLLIFILDMWHENAYRRCKKKCGTDECREWLCKYYHKRRKGK